MQSQILIGLLLQLPYILAGQKTFLQHEGETTRSMCENRHIFISFIFTAHSSKYHSIIIFFSLVLHVLSLRRRVTWKAQITAAKVRRDEHEKKPVSLRWHTYHFVCPFFRLRSLTDRLSVHWIHSNCQNLN